MTRLNCSPKITQNDFQETNHVRFLKQQFRDVLENKCFKILQNSQENTCAGISFLIKLQACGLQLYEKRGPGTGVFL